VVRYASVAVLSLAGASVLIRELGTEAWATYSVCYFVLISIDQALGARLLGGLIQARDAPSTSDMASAAFLMHVVGLGLAGVFGALAWVLSGRSALPDLGIALACLAVGTYVYALRTPAVVLLERRLGYRGIVVAEIVDQVTFYAIAIPLVVAGAGLKGALAAMAIRGLPATMGLRWRSAAPIFGRPDRDALRVLLVFSAPSLLVGGLFLVEGLVPAFVLAGSHPDVLAYVMTAGTLVGYASVVQYVTQRVGFPVFSRLASAPAELARAVARSFEMTALSVVTMVAPVTALSPIWLPALFGPEWDQAAGITVAIGIAFSANACLYVLTGALYAIGRPRLVLAMHSGCLALFAALAVVGTSQDALLGVAAGYALSRYAGLFAGWVLVKREVGGFSGVKGIGLLAWGAGASSATALAIDHGSTKALVACAVVFVTVWAALLWSNRSWVRRALRGTGPWIPAQGES